MHTNKKGFSLFEILIVVVIFSILTILSILLLDPKTIIERGGDTQRKTDLNTLKKKLEEYYNDTGCYPSPSALCYSSGQSLAQTYCIVCGKEPSSPLLSPYYERELPCNPTHPTSAYVYAVDTMTCPQSFVVYTKLSVRLDQDSIRLGCGEGGCGPTNTFGYDYAVSSPNAQVNKTGYFVGFTREGRCSRCDSSYDICISDSNYSEVYGSNSACCAAHPEGC